MHPHTPTAPRRRLTLAPVAMAALLIACGDREHPVGTVTADADDRVENRPSAAVLATPLAPRAATKAVRPALASQALDVVAASSGSVAMREVNGTDAPEASPASTTEVRPGTMLVRNAAITIRVDSLERAITRVRSLAQQVGGVVGGVEITTGEQSQRLASIELRVPVARFDEALTGVSPLGTVEHNTATAEDVGEEFVDVGARIANGHRVEERLLNLLATRSGKLADVLLLERELARVRGEIERAEGRHRYLGRRAATSTITLSLHEPLPILQRDPGEHPIRDAVLAAWRNFTGLVAFGVASLGYVVPLVLLGLVGYRARRGVRARGAVAAAAAGVNGD